MIRILFIVDDPAFGSLLWKINCSFGIACEFVLVYFKLDLRLTLSKFVPYS